MDRLALINTTRTVPMSLYKSGDLPEIRMREILLGYRFRAEIKSKCVAPELFFRWVHFDEWKEHHDKPCLHNYGSITIVKNSRNPNYALVQFFHPEVYFKTIKPSPRMTLPKLGTRSAVIRRFNRTYVDFLNKTEAAYLDSWIDKLLDDHEEYIATYDGKEPPRKRRRSPEFELFSSDSSDDESPLPSPSQLPKQHPVLSQSSMFDPPTDPRIIDLTNE